MTKRFASFMGAAAVAAMVILAGCGSGPGAKDYAADLAGTWTVRLMGPIPNPAGTEPATIDAQTDVTVTITKGTGVNMGTFSLTVVNTVSATPPIKTTGNGSLEVESASKMKVTLTEIMGPSVPAEATALKGTAQAVDYELMGNQLKLSSAVLMVMGVTTAANPQLTLMKQTPS